MSRPVPVLALILALAELLRLAPIDHRAPRGYVQDGYMVRNALGMAQEKDPVPPIAKYSTYPYLVPYLLLPVYDARYALGRVSGAWSGAGEFAMRAKERPSMVQTYGTCGTNVRCRDKKQQEVRAPHYRGLQPQGTAADRGSTHGLVRARDGLKAPQPISVQLRRELLFLVAAPYMYSAANFDDRLRRRSSA